MRLILTMSLIMVILSYIVSLPMGMVNIMPVMENQMLALRSCRDLLVLVRVNIITAVPLVVVITDMVIDPRVLVVIIINPVNQLLIDLHTLVLTLLRIIHLITTLTISIILGGIDLTLVCFKIFVHYICKFVLVSLCISFFN